MIPIQRTLEPRVLTKHKIRWTQEYLDARTAYHACSTSKNKRKMDTAESRYNHHDVKEALQEMFFGKCAYCESDIMHIDYGHIEHYRPKAKYPELCFAWDNLLLACGKCNGKRYKSDKFPLEPEGGPFVNPCDEHPDDFFEFEFDVQTGTANVIPKNIRGKTTEQELGLNRPELVRHRSNVVRKLAYIALRAKDGDADALSALKDCMENDREYAAFARTFAKRFNLS